MDKGVEPMMEFTLFRYPYLKYGACIFGCVAMAFAVLFSGFAIDGLPVAVLIGCVVLAALFLGLGVWVVCSYKQFFSVFEVNAEGIRYVHPKKGEMLFLWNEIAESGINVIVSYNSHSHEKHKYIYVSKKILKDRERQKLMTDVTPTIFCTDYRAEIIDEIRQYHPIPLEDGAHYNPYRPLDPDAENS